MAGWKDFWAPYTPEQQATVAAGVAIVWEVAAGLYGAAGVTGTAALSRAGGQNAGEIEGATSSIGRNILEAGSFPGQYTPTTGPMRQAVGRLGEAAEDIKMMSQGYAIDGKNINVQANGVNGQLDRLYRNIDTGARTIKEVKTNGALLTDGQAEAYKAGAAGTAVRPNGARAGLINGATLEDQGVTLSPVVRYKVAR